MAEADKLREKILEEARQQAETIVRHAENEAADILNAAKAEAGEKEQLATEKAQREAEERKKRLLASADLEGRKQVLQVKQDLIDEAFAKAIDKMGSLPAQQYVKIIASMVVEAVSSGTEEIILSKKDKDTFGTDIIKAVNSSLSEKGIKNAVKLSEITKDIKGGFILRSGDIEINNSFDAIIKMRRDELEPEVVSVLFGRE